MVTLREVQEDPENVTSLLAGFKQRPEIVSLNVVDGVPLLIIRACARNDRPGRYNMDLYDYSLFTTNDNKWSADSTLDEAGFLAFTQTKDWGETEIEVIESNISPALRGRGIGKYIYKTAINDLRDLGYAHVFSDEEIDRSHDAERLWESLVRDNPDRIKNTWTDDPNRVAFERSEGQYHVTGYIERRPVRVHRHRRRHG